MIILWFWLCSPNWLTWSVKKKFNAIFHQFINHVRLILFVNDFDMHEWRSCFSTLIESFIRFTAARSQENREIEYNVMAKKKLILCIFQVSFKHNYTSSQQLFTLKVLRSCLMPFSEQLLSIKFVSIKKFTTDLKRANFAVSMSNN